jgi:hypothetical protein
MDEAGIMVGLDQEEAFASTVMMALSALLQNVDST